MMHSRVVRHHIHQHRRRTPIGYQRWIFVRFGHRDEGPAAVSIRCSLVKCSVLGDASPQRIDHESHLQSCGQATIR
jgi:hypothetical protein